MIVRIPPYPAERGQISGETELDNLIKRPRKLFIVMDSSNRVICGTQAIRLKTKTKFIYLLYKAASRMGRPPPRLQACDKFRNEDIVNSNGPEALL